MGARKVVRLQMPMFAARGTVLLLPHAPRPATLRAGRAVLEEGVTGLVLADTPAGAFADVQVAGWDQVARKQA